jgi:hypothetical protein
VVVSTYLGPLFCIPRGTLRERFERFHKDNPHVYALLRRFALEAKRRGRGQFSMDAIYHRARWFTRVETSERDWKLNNDHTAYYSRMLMEREPELDGFFETRALAVDRHG